MKTITIVYDPGQCRLADGEEFNLLEHLRSSLDDTEIRAQISEGEGPSVAQTARVLITIEGGAFQGARANLPLQVDLFDVDNLKAEGKDEAQRQAIWNELSAELTIPVA